MGIEAGIKSKVDVSLKLWATVRFDKDADAFVSYCPLLNIFSQGTSEQEALRAIEEAAQMFLESCDDRKLTISGIRVR